MECYWSEDQVGVMEPRWRSPRWSLLAACTLLGVMSHFWFLRVGMIIGDGSPLDGEAMKAGRLNLQRLGRGRFCVRFCTGTDKKGALLCGYVMKHVRAVSLWLFPLSGQKSVCPFWLVDRKCGRVGDGSRGGSVHFSADRCGFLWVPSAPHLSSFVINHASCQRFLEL